MMAAYLFGLSVVGAVFAFGASILIVVCLISAERWYAKVLGWILFVHLAIGAVMLGVVTK